MKKPHAIILGLYGENAAGVVRSLGIGNIPIAGFHINKKYPHAYPSKYIDTKELVQDKESLLEKLVEFGKKQDEKGVVFCTGDDYVLFAQENAQELQPYFILPLSEYGDIREIIKKTNILDVGKKAGFNVPSSANLSSEDVFNLEFPVILKPLYSVGFSKSDMKIIKTKEELKRIRKETLTKYKDLEVETFIPGPAQNQIEIHTYLTKNGKAVIGGMLEYYTQYTEENLETYVSSIDRSIWLEELVEPAENITKILKFTGALDINLKINEDNKKAYFYEVNLRTSANLMLDTAFGINLPAVIYLDQTGNNYSPLTEKKHKKGKYWIGDRVIDLSLKQGLVSLEDLQKYLENGIHSIFDPEDLQPFYFSFVTGNLPLVIKK